MTHKLAAVVCAAALLSAAAVAQGPRRDGSWEMTLQMEMAGMPQKMPPQTVKQCITKEQADNPTLLMQQAGRGTPPDCKVTDQKISADKVTWSMSCGGANPMTGTGEMVYGADTVDGVIKMTMDAGGKPMTMTMTAKGKRLGDCVK